MGETTGFGVFRSLFGLLGPFLEEELKVGMDVLLKLTNRFGAEGMGDNLALAGVFSSIAGVEQTSSDGNECIIVFTGSISSDYERL